MKNELGIEVCCENCYLNFDCNLLVEKNCIINGQYLSFLPSIEASSERIKELQAKLEKYKQDEGDAGPFYEGFSEEDLDETEQSLKNSEGNLKKQQ
jgi:hypothetical protein